VETKKEQATAGVENDNEFTGLMKQKYETEGYIEQAYWMQGEYSVFVTMDEANYLYVEVFSFEDAIERICDRVFICDASQHEHLEVAVNPTREIIALVLFNNVSPFLGHHILFRIRTPRKWPRALLLAVTSAIRSMATRSTLRHSMRARAERTSRSKT